jgi:hypothetical protein
MHMAIHCRAATIQVDLSAEVTFAFDVAEHFERVVQAGARRLRLEFGDRPECDAEVGLERIRQEHPETNDTTDQVRKSMLAQSACVRVSCQLRAGVPLRGQLHTGSS